MFLNTNFLGFSIFVLLNLFLVIIDFRQQQRIFH
ncbi:hypothetical protein [Acinetobacter phage Ab69]|nr:hypothetical protein [Acinetobacter phage Ab69]